MIWMVQLLFGGVVDPIGFSLDLPKFADGRVVEHDVALAVCPLGSEFLVGERRL